ncbi:hypothetical protein MNB_SM-5-1367 [hydrothermal vent metagenome]|uniref:GGDEF domain-containing protein n=1 Tax=hydrothermal vent metagenome TaxID=652676 RepID=A0A1W1BC13_9ZZZZ
MIEIAKLIHADKHRFYELIEGEISQFLYREKRYHQPFSLVAIYAVNATTLTLSLLKEKLRLSDKPIVLNDHLICIAFDNTTEDTYVKTAENLTSFLKKSDYTNNFFLSSVHSSEFPDNTLEMTNTLFDRLQYALEHKLYNTVVYEDYLI